MKIRILPFTAAFALVLALGACKGEDAPAPAPGEPVPPSADYSDGGLDKPVEGTPKDEAVTDADGNPRTHVEAETVDAEDTEAPPTKGDEEDEDHGDHQE